MAELRIECKQLQVPQERHGSLLSPEVGQPEFHVELPGAIISCLDTLGCGGNIAQNRPSGKSPEETKTISTVSDPLICRSTLGPLGFLAALGSR